MRKNGNKKLIFLVSIGISVLLVTSSYPKIVNGDHGNGGTYAFRSLAYFSATAYATYCAANQGATFGVFEYPGFFAVNCDSEEMHYNYEEINPIKDSQASYVETVDGMAYYLLGAILVVIIVTVGLIIIGGGSGGSCSVMGWLIGSPVIMC